MSNYEQQILAWAKKSLGFASQSDAALFAANGALFIGPSDGSNGGSYKILVEGSNGGVQWIALQNVTGAILHEVVTPWLTGKVGVIGISASFQALTSPPKTRYGFDIVRVPTIKHFMNQQRPYQRTEWLNLQTGRNNGQSDDGTRKQKPDPLRTMTYQQYLNSEHWIKARDAALKRAHNRCQVCNADINLKVHHRCYDRLGCELPSDLTVLCNHCHQTFHDKLPAPPTES